MNRAALYVILTALLMALAWPALPQTVTNPVTRLALTAQNWVLTGTWNFQGAVTLASATLSGATALSGNDINVNEQTALVLPGQSATINKAVGFDHAWLKSVEVRSGCGAGTDTYDFALYQDDGFDQGEELLVVIGQTFNYYDGAPPVLRDTDGTGEIHAKFWNRGTMGCTFNLIVSGVGF